MAAYHQMGHDSWNLVAEAALKSFRGMVLSPVNSSPSEVEEKLNDLGSIAKGMDIVLDPQFYKPTSERGKLPDWSYFVSGLDTADLTDTKWWSDRYTKLLADAKRVGANAVASPAIIPRTFDAAYYDSIVSNADAFQELATGEGIAALATTIVRLPELGQKDQAEQIASIVTRSKVPRIYLVPFDDTPPREQRRDAEAIAGVVSLIRLLEQAGTRVLVAFTGLDMLLWKYAGATDVATGKFFNLRRFVPGRWDDSAEGGRLRPYWTDQELVTWLREEDVRILRQRKVLDPKASLPGNPYASQIVEILDRNKGEAWVKLGWCQYLHWFSQRETEIAAGKVDVRAMLEHADRRWNAVRDSKALLIEATNNGEWVRAWLNALLLSDPT